MSLKRSPWRWKWWKARLLHLRGRLGHDNDSQMSLMCLSAASIGTGGFWVYGMLTSCAQVSHSLFDSQIHSIFYIDCVDSTYPAVARPISSNFHILKFVFSELVSTCRMDVPKLNREECRDTKNMLTQRQKCFERSWDVTGFWLASLPFCDIPNTSDGRNIRPLSVLALSKKELWSHHTLK